MMCLKQSDSVGLDILMQINPYLGSEKAIGDYFA